METNEPVSTDTLFQAGSFPGYAVNEKIPTLPQVLNGAAPANTAPVRVDLEEAGKLEAVVA